MWFFILSIAAPLSLCAHPKLANFATEEPHSSYETWRVKQRRSEKPEKITRNEKKSQEIIYKIDMFHHVPWILMHL